MLIRNAQIWRGPTCDLRLANGSIATLGNLQPRAGERVIDASGGALLPGLHDHHIHLAATAAMLRSLFCGPPEVTNEAGLIEALQAHPGNDWLRGIGYHESVAGLLSRDQLDAMVADRPVRIQHRSGRMWFLNSLAIETLLGLAKAPAGLEIASGQLFDEDDWLRATLSGSPPELGTLSRQMAACGVTGLTDMSPSNDAATVEWLAAQNASGDLLQSCVLAGRDKLAHVTMPRGFALGPLKLHLHEHGLPDIDATIAAVAHSHAQGRPIAVHCVSEVEMVFTLAVLMEAGANKGDRIEHAGIATDEHITTCAGMGLQVVSQPHFIAERGDQFRAALPAAEHPLLYRLAAFARAGVVLAAGSDAPYGSTDPWAAMRAAVNRTTRQGGCLGPDEALSPEDALELFLKDPLDLQRVRLIEEGAPADLCLLDRPWEQVRNRLQADDVRLVVAGEVIYEREAQSASGAATALLDHQPNDFVA